MRVPDTNTIHNKFKRKRANKDWSFIGNRSTNNLTHGYHRYPAKFLPELVKKLIETHTNENDTIADVFAGCGTTLVEGKLQGRNTIGVDINPVAQLITRAKLNQVLPSKLEDEYTKLIEKINCYSHKKEYASHTHPKIDYWFTNATKNKIAFLYGNILTIEHTKSKEFFLCALSHILKNCSRWLQDSTKPQIDPNKIIPEVFSAFKKHVEKMMIKNKEYYVRLQNGNLLKTRAKISLADARDTKIKKGSISAIITSPPYVTSYEYADIHQLTAYWYNYITDIAPFRKKFIGTFHSSNQAIRVSKYCPTGKNIVQALYEIDKRSAKEVANYFNDMLDVAKEMKRILKKNGVACLVIGNTEIRNIKVKSAEVFAEMLYSVGFEIEDVIKRNITSKIIPTIRDKKSGKFTSEESSNSKRVYPEEFIIIARKL